MLDVLVLLNELLCILFTLISTEHKKVINALQSTIEQFELLLWMLILKTGMKYFIQILHYIYIYKYKQANRECLYASSKWRHIVIYWLRNRCNIYLHIFKNLQISTLLINHLKLMIKWNSNTNFPEIYPVSTLFS